MLGRRFTVVTDHRALPRLHSIKDPDGITARWLEELAPFDYELRHRPGKSVRHAVGLSRIPASMNAVAEKFQEPDSHICSDIQDPNYSPDISKDTEHGLSYPDKRPNPDLLSLPANDSRQDEVTGHYREVVGNLFDSKDSIGHRVSADFKKSAIIARKIRRNYPCAYPTNLDHTLAVLWSQWLPDSKRFIFHLITQQKFFKSASGTLRASWSECAPRPNGKTSREPACRALDRVLTNLKRARCDN